MWESWEGRVEYVSVGDVVICRHWTGEYGGIIEYVWLGSRGANEYVGIQPLHMQPYLRDNTFIENYWGVD